MVGSIRKGRPHRLLMWQAQVMTGQPDAGSLQDAMLIAQQQWQLNEIRELVRCFARDGNGIAPPEAFAYLDLMVEAIVEDPERVMSINADMSRLLSDGGSASRPDQS